MIVGTHVLLYTTEPDALSSIPLPRWQTCGRRAWR